jgi:hypothetical protein
VRQQLPLGSTKLKQGRGQGDVQQEEEGVQAELDYKQTWELYLPQGARGQVRRAGCWGFQRTQLYGNSHDQTLNTGHIPGNLVC